MKDDSVSESGQGTSKAHAGRGRGRPRKAEPAQSSIARRTTERLAARGFCGVPSYFLQNYHRLPPPTPGQRGLTSTEAMLLIHLLDFKWDEHPPFPALETLAERMGITARAVRKAMVHLEECKFLERIPDRRRTNRYDMTGLFRALEKLMDDDGAKPSVAKPMADFTTEAVAA